MNEDIVKGKWLEIKGGLKRSGANSRITIFARSKESEKLLGLFTEEVWTS